MKVQNLSKRIFLVIVILTISSPSYSFNDSHREHAKGGLLYMDRQTILPDFSSPLFQWWKKEKKKEKQDFLIGKWEAQRFRNKTQYVFNSDGTLSYRKKKTSMKTKNGSYIHDKSKNTIMIQIDGQVETIKYSKESNTEITFDDVTWKKLDEED